VRRCVPNASGALHLDHGSRVETDLFAVVAYARYSNLSVIAIPYLSILFRDQCQSLGRLPPLGQLLPAGEYERHRWRIRYASQRVSDEASDIANAHDVDSAVERRTRAVEIGRIVESAWAKRLVFDIVTTMYESGVGQMGGSTNVFFISSSLSALPALFQLFMNVLL
jgi:hypothetical protein